MPWHIEENHDGCPDDRPFAVVKDDDGEVEGCHETEGDAEDQLAALYAAEDEMSNYTTENNRGFFPARITFERLTPIEELQKLMSDIEDMDPFFWAAEISSSRLDSYFTHMGDSTLRNFAADAAKGVMFLDSHNSSRLGYGQSLTGIMETNGDISRVISDFYTVRGIKFGGGMTYASTDDFIRSVETRITRDVSVGFFDGDMICDICGNSFWDYANCPHWPGQEYAIGEQGEQTKVATFEIVDAHLAEVSGVFDGATPEAMILRAQQMADAGLLPPEQARRLEVRYRIDLPQARHNWPGQELRSKKNMSNQNTTPEPDESKETLAKIRAELEVTGAPDKSDPIAAIRWLADEIQRLTPLADQGQQYRSDLIDEAIAEGVRAMGNEFPEETYRDMLSATGLDQIKQLRDAWKKQADEVFTGGRRTVDEEEEPEPAPSNSTIPDYAYKS